jgi:ferredoxin
LEGGLKPSLPIFHLPHFSTTETNVTPDNRPSPAPDPLPQLQSANPSVDWEARQRPPLRRLLNALERLSLALEKPVARLVSDQRFNPLYHTGTITVFLLFIILGTGIYLTMFYQFGFEVSYQAVATIEANFVGRAVRALHRYASGAAVITALLHGWRTFFQDRFRGPRWLAWVTGVGMAALVWLIGISGYWLIWDERAQLFNQTLINLIHNSQAGTAFLLGQIIDPAASSGWVFMVLLISIHLGLSALVGLFFWWHIQRLSRAKWLPPRYWMAVIGALLVAASILLPVGMLPALDPARLPAGISVDSFYLFYLPAALRWPAALFWGGALLLIALAALIPWLLARKPLPPVKVAAERCTGCTLCAADCPYKAIRMIERSDGKKHKYLAEIDPKLCVACGICIGSCAPLALTLGDQPAEPLWQATLARISAGGGETPKVIFACERHISQNLAHLPQGEQTLLVPLTCAGMAHPDLAVQALQAGAGEVQFIGCPPEDCANREGNLWLQARLARQRLPRLKSNFAGAPIRADWLPPHDLARAAAQPQPVSQATAYTLEFSKLNWRKFIPAIVLLGVVLAAQIWLSDCSYQPYPAAAALLEVALNHRAGYPLEETATPLEPQLGLVEPTRLILEVDGKVEFEKVYPLQGRENRALAFEQIALLPGAHDIRLTMFDRPGQAQGALIFDGRVDFDERQVLRLGYRDAAVGSDPVAGEKLFNESSLGASASCHLCHSLEPGEVIVGPSLAGVAGRAAERVPGLNAEDYLRQSMVNPDAYVVEGFPPGLMIPNLEETLSAAQIDDLVAFLLTLK